MKSKELWEENEQSKSGDEDYRYTEPCKCACHENKLHKQYAHSGQCCENMNGYIKNCDCTTKYCKHYKSDFDKFLEATAEVTIKAFIIINKRTGKHENERLAPEVYLSEVVIPLKYQKTIKCVPCVITYQI